MRWLAAGVGVVGVVLAAGCASGPTGTVTGKFEMEAGPISTTTGQAAIGPLPLSGVVRFIDAGGHTVDATVGASGKFSVRLAPGTYRVEGITSEMGAVDPNSGMSQPPCNGQYMSPTRVRAGQTAQITVICYGP